MDEIVFRIAEHILEKGTSISKVQRELELTYNEAAQAYETLEEAGIIGPFEYGDRQRELKVRTIEEVHEILSNAD